jgi:sulfoxide reductase heme-binding subunit YedZ
MEERSGSKDIRVRIFIYALCLCPLFYLIASALTGALGANPVEKVIHLTGLSTYYFIILTLAVTPAAALFKIKRLPKYRRSLGLFTFFYASLHVIFYAGVDHLFNFREIFEDMLKHKRIFAGVGAYLIMIPLAVTSAGWARRTLGGKTWKVVHRFFYLSAVASATHYLLLVKRDLQKPVIYFTVVLLLLLYRLIPKKRW